MMDPNKPDWVEDATEEEREVREEDLHVGAVYWDSHHTRQCWVQLESVDACGVWTGMYETGDIGPLDPGDLHYEEQSSIFKEEQ